MKKIFILLTILFLISCSNDETYNDNLQKGLEYIASEEYKEAEVAFELALNERKDDEKSTALLKQTLYFQEVLAAIEDKEWDKVVKKADKIIEIKGGSSDLVFKAKDAIESSNKVQKDRKIGKDEMKQVELEDNDLVSDKSVRSGKDINQIKGGNEEVNYNDYETYHDKPYGYTIDYPVAFVPGPAQGDPDAMRFKSDDGEILVYGSHHIKTDYGVINAGYSNAIKDLYDYELSNLAKENIQVTYKKIDQAEKWFVFSYNYDDKIIYQKTISSENSFVKLIFVYPKDAQSKYGPIIEHVVESFTF